jgi:hypothetical protein
MSYGLRGHNGRISGLGIFNPAGLGFDYYDLLKSAGGTQTCDPRDSACVAQNEQITDAVRALWTSQYMTNPDVANQAVPDVSVNLQTSPAALQQYMQNIPVTSETISVDGGPVQTAAQWLAGPVAPAPVVKAVAPAAKASAPAPAAGPSAVPAAEGAPALSSSLSLPTVGGFDLSSIPWWGWAGAAGVALFMFGGGRGR